MMYQAGISRMQSRQNLLHKAYDYWIRLQEQVLQLLEQVRHHHQFVEGFLVSLHSHY